MSVKTEIPRWIFFPRKCKSVFNHSDEGLVGYLKNVSEYADEIEDGSYWQGFQRNASCSYEYRTHTAKLRRLIIAA